MPPKDDFKDNLTGETITGRFRIISRLGEGGMGVAYRAWDEQAGVPVVIKIPKKLFLEDPTFAERFRREIRLLQGLVHPHIVPIVDVGGHEGLPFVVMRFLPGGSLSNRRLRDEHGKVRPNPPGMLHLWLPAVADALDFIHAHGVVHRDVKPANIFFDAFWSAYLGDFGIAKIVEESDVFDKEHTLTATHMGIGTGEYMAPEQFAPKAAIDGWADQYALAVMTYEMLAGQRPFTGATANLIVEVTTQSVPPLQARRSDLPASLVSAVHRGLAKQPVERFATCSEFARAALIDVQPIEDEPGVARLLCPKCVNVLKLPTNAAGQKGKCPKCQSQMKVADDLGALWLLDEARRQRKAVRSGETAGTDSSRQSDESPATEYVEDESAEVFKPVSSTTPFDKATRRPATRARSLAIWGGLAATLMAAVVIWSSVPGAKTKTRTNPPPPTYEERLAEAEAKLKVDPSDRAANEILGRHWCFKERDWDKGLPHLAQGTTIGFCSAANKELKARKASPADSGDLMRAARGWWAVATQSAMNMEEATAEIIKDHAATIYLAVVGDLRADKDIEEAHGWLDQDSEFQAMVGNKRPAKKRMTAEEIIAQSPVTNSIGLRLKLIPPGSFMMGANDGQPDEKPVHEVRITKPFYLGVYEVTNAQWKAVMGDVPSDGQDDDRPVERVTWDDAVKFCAKLSGLPAERAAGRVYRLPTEAEWEYACRAGTKTRFSFGDADASLGDFAWFENVAGGRRHAVGQKKPNPWGLYDMHGNMWEWCGDWHSPYGAGGVSDPVGPVQGSARVGRGGGWHNTSGGCSSTIRNVIPPTCRNHDLGFRVAATLSEATTTDTNRDGGRTRPPAFLADLPITSRKSHFFHNRINWQPIGGKRYANTIHIHPEVGSGQSQLVFEIDGKYDELVGAIGILDSAKHVASPQVFRIVGDGKELWKSAPFRQAGRGEDFRVNVSGVKTLELHADSTGPRYDAHCVWIDPQLIVFAKE